MRPRVLAAALVAGLVAFAGPAWSHSPGGGNAGGGHASGGGHSMSGGHMSGGVHSMSVGHTSGGGHSMSVGHMSSGAHSMSGGHMSSGAHSMSGGHMSSGGHSMSVGHMSGGGHSMSVGHMSGGGHSMSVGHTSGGGHVAGGGHGGTLVQPRGDLLHRGSGYLGGGGQRGWRGYHGRGGNYGWGGYYGWGDPFWWGAFWGLGWPYAWGGYYGPWYDTPGYYGSETLVAPADNLTPVETNVSPADDLTPVETNVSPEEALVYLNGVLIGTARDFTGESDVLYLGAGHYTVEFRLPGYHSRALELDATGGEATIPIALELVPDHSRGAVAPYRPPQGLPYGRVFGPDFGDAVSQQEPRPAWGPRPGLRLESRPDAGTVATPRPTTANPGLAALKLHVSPPNAAIYLDGDFLGSGAELGRLQRGVAILSGPHRIEVLAPGYAAKSMVIETEPGKELQVTVELEPAR